MLVLIIENAKNSDLRATLVVFYCMAYSVGLIIISFFAILAKTWIELQIYLVILMVPAVLITWFIAEESLPWTEKNKIRTSEKLKVKNREINEDFVKVESIEKSVLLLADDDLESSSLFYNLQGGFLGMSFFGQKTRFGVKKGILGQRRHFRSFLGQNSSF